MDLFAGSSELPDRDDGVDGNLSVSGCLGLLVVRRVLLFGCLLGSLEEDDEDDEETGADESEGDINGGKEAVR